MLVASVTAYQGLPFGSDYCAAKAGVRGILQSIRKPDAGMAQYQANLVAPAFTRSVKTQSCEKNWEKQNFKLGDADDVVAAALRCVCDSDVAARAIACPPGAPGLSGAANFDLHDDLIDGSGSRMLLHKLKEGVFGDLSKLI